MRTALAAILLALSPAAAFAKTYVAEQFTSRIEVMIGGSLQVTETITFRFEDGTFSQVFRTIPTGHTDGVRFLAASMDGVPTPEGEGPGHVALRRQNGLRVTWTFAPIGPSTHTFTLTYIAAGVVRRANDQDVVAWRALPTEHAYRIEDARVEVVSPAPPADPPVLQMHRVGQYDLEDGGARVVVEANDIGRNGWIEVWLRFPAGRVIAQLPAWQQRREHYDEYRNPSMVAAAMVLFAGLVLLFTMKQGYETPPPDAQSWRSFSGPPEAIAPALAGALAANGRPLLEHAMAAIFSMASRGIVTVTEEAHHMLMAKRFAIEYTGGAALAPHEAAVLETVFGHPPSPRDRVNLHAARARLVRRFSHFKTATLRELEGGGLLDASRRRLQSRYLRTALVFVAAAALAIAPLLVAVNTYGPWPLLVPAAIVALGIISIMFAAALTPLSNEGVRRAQQWRAYRRHLRELRNGSIGMLGGASLADVLPLAVALGLASLWAKLFKQHAVPMPPWFHAAAGADQGAFVAFLAHGGAGAGSHGGGGAGGAAGGGASGAS